MKGLLFTYGLTYGGAAASLVQPFLGLLIYVAFSILKPEALWFWSVPQGNYSRIVAVALLMGWAIQGFGTWQFGRAKGVVSALLWYSFWAVVCAALSPVPNLGWGYVEKLAKIVLPFLAGITLIDSVAKLKLLAWVMVLSQGYQAAWFNELYFRGFLQHGIDSVEFAGMDNNSIAIGMCTCVGLAFFLGLHVEKLWQRLLAFTAAALMAHSVMFMFSRGGMLAMVVTGIVSLLLLTRQPKHYFYFLLGAAIAVALAGQEVRQRFISAFVDEKARDEAASSRMRQWNYCLDAIAAHPIVGVGPDHWFRSEMNEGGGEAHSVWLQTAAEMGLPGLLFLALFYGRCVFRLFRVARQRHWPYDPWLQGAARMVIASLVGFAVSAQFVSLKDLEQPYYVTLIGAGVLRILVMPAAAGARGLVAAPRAAA